MIPYYELIPEITMYSLRQYVEHHVDPGDFLIALLSNDLKEAFGRADDENIQAMFHTVAYCFNHVPSDCWGSRAAVIKWLEQRKEVEEPGGNADRQLLLPLQ